LSVAGGERGDGFTAEGAESAEEWERRFGVASCRWQKGGRGMISPRRARRARRGEQRRWAGVPWELWGTK